MNQAPASDPENAEYFATAAGTTGSPWTAIAVDTPTEFRIDPAPYPTASAVAMGLVCLAAGYGFHVLLKSGVEGPQAAWVPYFVPAGAALIAGGGCAAFRAWEF